MVIGSIADGIVVSVLTDALLVAGAAGYAWWQATTADPIWQGDVVPSATEEPVPAVA